MVAGRVAAGLTVALLLIGAAVHYRPARQVSDDYFVSAATDSDSFPACVEQAEGTAADFTDPLTVAAKACGCGKSVCTAGRVCVLDPKKEGNDKCYLPRCNVGTTTAIPDEYIAGCICGESAIFKSTGGTSATAPSYLAPGMEDCEDGKVSEMEDKCVCGTSVCTKGQLCKSADNFCDGAVSDPALAAYLAQTTAFVYPHNLTDPTKFAICKNTNSGGKQACSEKAEVKCAKPA